MNLSLHDKLSIGVHHLGGHDCYQKRVPKYVQQNINSKFQLRPYQLEALGRFIYFIEKYKDNRILPQRTLFHMATGSGKTLIMAGLVLYLYLRGYRNFLFCVNRDNIIHQTREVFLNPSATKYLFAQSIVLDGRRVFIREVDSFRSKETKNINIVFSTVQGLHSRLNAPRENSVTYEELENEKLVLISDEAHHINVGTRKRKSPNQTSFLLEEPSWEQTIERVFQSEKENILLEFTATMDLSHEAVWEKYRNSIVFDYPLRQFRLEKYSKEVKVLQADLEHFDRALQALIISQLRRKIFSKYKILIKPVILFKSKTIKESESFQKAFSKKVKALTSEDLASLLNVNDADPVISQVKKFLLKNKISLDNFVTELKEDFDDNKCISVNSKDESEKKQIAINSLEDPNNEFRAVFAVDKLNEGWDVLNLFDIVRLYDTRDSGKGKVGKTTLSEAQLIGRGARYCPFKIQKNQEEYQRKYDTVFSEDEVDLQLCEVLYYHSKHNTKYISDLRTALIETGILASNHRKQELQLKSKFKTTRFYKFGYVYSNNQERYTREDVTGISDSFIDEIHQVKLPTAQSASSVIFEDDGVLSFTTRRQKYYLNSFGQNVIRKGIYGVPDFHFCNLQNWFPQLRSTTEFVTDDRYLGNIKVEVEGPEQIVSNLSQKHKLFVTVTILTKLAKQMHASNVKFRGARKFNPQAVNSVFTDKMLNFSIESPTQERGFGQNETNNPNLKLDLSEIEWYVFNDCFGTSEEKRFVKYVSEIIHELKERYSQIYLVRNERHLKIYNFDDGRAFEPDFILFLLDEFGNRGIQVFIEPKGSHLVEHDKWKEDLLLTISNSQELKKIKRGRYTLWGLPFFNKEKRDVFDRALRVEILNRNSKNQ